MAMIETGKFTRDYGKVRGIEALGPGVPPAEAPSSAAFLVCSAVASVISSQRDPGV